MLATAAAVAQAAGQIPEGGGDLIQEGGRDLIPEGGRDLIPEGGSGPSLDTRGGSKDHGPRRRHPRAFLCGG